MLKLEIELDEKKLKALDFDINKVTEFISNGLLKVGLIEEKVENCYFLYHGPGLNTDLAHIGTIVIDVFLTYDWFKISCKKLNLLDNSDSKDGSFYVDGDFIKSAKKCGRW